MAESLAPFHASSRKIASHKQFLALALKAYRGTNSDGRKRLRQWLKEFGRSA